MPSIGPALVNNIASIANPSGTKTPAAEAGGENSFKNVLNEALEKFDAVGDGNAQSSLELLTGKTDDLSETMIASQKAEIALNLTVAIRDKAVSAYKEIMNMQV